ncbi:MAG TPA: TrkA family potassium uptake protein [Anaerolineae bacterium]|nr:TrkA family potassium uptake protein [Anaerolineae bacterium]HOR00884.1 TrkA family potassium uptake protein [Anaerolineae bacterium]HPL28014.1 TrkA family potassium uptake protein [Anaerolineae bacterium]
MRFVIVGCGRVGARVSSQLSLAGHDVAVIDRDPEAFLRLSPTFKGETIEGVGFDRTVLIRAGIERADGFASVTNGDNTNIVSARTARYVFRVPMVVTRIYDPRRAEIYRRLGIPTISPTDWGATAIAEMLLHPGLATSLTMGHGEVTLVEYVVSEYVSGHAVDELSFPGEMMVAGLVRGGRATLPTPGTRLQLGDTLYISVQTASRGRLQQMLRLP